jgi:L,D-transpeptidase catalytic domain
VSSGCIRLFNHDIIDLYNRAPVGTQVVVLQEGEAMRAEAGLETDRAYYDPYEPEAIGPYAGPPGPYAGPPAPYAGPYYEPPPWASGY